jgi:hypothetical protein
MAQAGFFFLETEFLIFYLSFRILCSQFNQISMMDEEGWQIAGPAPESAGRRRGGRGGRSGRRRGGKGEGATTPHFQYREQTNHKSRRAAASSDEDDTATALQRWEVRLSTFKCVPF